MRGGSIRGVYVTVRVTTSRMWRMLVLAAFVAVVTDVDEVDVEVEVEVEVDLDDEVAAGGATAGLHFEQVVFCVWDCERTTGCALGDLNSAYRALRADSQSKAVVMLVDLALKGDRMGELVLDTAGEPGIFRLGNVVFPMGGADIGQLLAAKELAGIAVSMREILGDLWARSRRLWS